MADSWPMVFVETPIFNRRVQQYMEDDEYGEMQAYLKQLRNQLVP